VPASSAKHVVDVATAAVPAGLVSTVVVAESEDSPALAATQEVNKGCIINGVYLLVETIHNSGTWVTIPRVYMTVFKNPGAALPAVYPANVGSNDLKKFVIHQEMLMMTGVSADANSFPRTMFKGVIKIPSRYRRFGENDRLLVQFALDTAETTATVSTCVQCIYKEYF